MALAEIFKKEIVPKLKQELGKKNILATPVLSKIVINVGIGTYVKTNRDFSWIEEDIKMLSGQKPVVKLAKKSVSNFKLREGQPNGLTVVLRGKRMYDFLERLISVTLPRVHDFKGLSPRAFDGNGNYTLGLKDHMVFPEVKLNELNRIFGLEITIVTTATNNDDGRALLNSLGFPFRQ